MSDTRFYNTWYLVLFFRLQFEIHLYSISKKINYEKFNIFTCRIVLPDINLCSYYCQLCKARLSPAGQSLIIHNADTLLALISVLVYKVLSRQDFIVNDNSNRIVFEIVIKT